MKSKKTIVSVLNLVLFLASFTLLSFNSFSNSSGQHSVAHSYKQFCETPGSFADNTSQQLSEKNETETEDGSELQALTLPFFFSFFQHEIIRSSCIPATALAEQLTNSIYISVCNFRI